MRKLSCAGLMAVALLALAGCDKVEENTTIVNSTTSAPVNSPAHNQGRSCTDCHDWNLVQLHDSASPDYNGDCLKCHGDMTDGTTLSELVQAIHPRMNPYVYQAAGETTVTNNVCIHCHTSVDFLEGSAGGIRKQVAPQKCVTCHTVAGPGGQLYQN